MDWNALVRFVRAENPAFLAAFRGVPPEEVHAVEELCGVHLPDSYREFLGRMGRDSGRFYLFGPGHAQELETLRADLPADSYPARYFKVAVPVVDSDISPLDYFLDLERSDGVDAPIVTFEDMGHFRQEYVRDLGFTFGEWVTHAIFMFLAIGHEPEQASVVIGSPSPKAAPGLKDEAVALLERMNFALVLPSLERVACLRRGQLGAMVDVLVGGLAVAINLGADDRRALEIVVDQLLMRFPDAAVSGVGGPPRAGE
jgi:hypothetical protein